jgi:tetratricopeptide (TPR) repeat protein
MTTRALLSLLALTLSAELAGAQACVIETSRPALLSGARRYVTLIGASERAGEKPNHLRSGARVLVEQTENIDNQIGRWYLLGKLYTLWVRTDGAEPITTRGFLTLNGDQNEEVDLYAEIAKAFDKVEALNPACVDSTRPYRMSVYGGLYNSALELRNAEQYDSAETLARRALVLNPKSTGSWNVIASARKAKGDEAGHEEMIKKVIEVGLIDPDGKALATAAMYNLGVTKLNASLELEGAAQMAKAKEAEQLFRQYLTLEPGSGEAASALARALRVQGDESGMEGIFASMLNEPAKYTAGQLFEAGVGSMQGEEYELAIRLFESGLEKNPYFRDALFNLANAYFSVDSAAKMLSTLQRLVVVDPSNADNYRLMAGAWQRVSRGLTVQAEVKAAQDSLLHYLELSQTIPVHVRVSWIPTRNAGVVDVVVENRAEATASYVVDFDFLDAKGAVVKSGKASVSAVDPKAAKAARVEVEGPGIVAYRYKIGS